MKMLKKLLLAGLVAASSLLAKAESTNVVEVLGEVKDSMLSTISAAFPYLALVVVAALGIWMVPKGIRWLKSGVGR